MTVRFASFATLTAAALWTTLVVPLAAQTADGLVAKNVTIANTTFKGRSAIQLVATPGVSSRIICE